MQRIQHIQQRRSYSGCTVEEPLKNGAKTVQIHPVLSQISAVFTVIYSDFYSKINLEHGGEERLS